jgi:prolyl oligopeptidase
MARDAWSGRSCRYRLSPRRNNEDSVLNAIERHLRRALLLTAVLATTACFAADGPPVAAVKPVTDTYFDTPVVDNYRYLENLKDPEVQAWMKAQSDYTKAYLAKIPGRETLLARIHELSNVDTRRGGFLQRGKRYFYQVTEPGAEQPKLVYRDGLNGDEHLLLDPSTLGAGTSTHYALDYYEPSWDGKSVALGLSAGGSEQSTLHVMDVASGKDLGEKIGRTDNAVVTWRPDNRSFFYLKFPKPTPDTPANETEYNARTYLHVVGKELDGENDAVVFGRGVSKLDVPAGQATYVIGSPKSPWVVAIANHNFDDNPSTIYVAKLAQVTGASTPWKKVADVDDGISQVIARGDLLYFLSRKDASHFRILATPFAHPDVKHARVIVAEGAGIVTGFATAQDGLYYRERDGVVSKLMRVGLDGKSPHAIPLPFEGNMFGPTTDPDQPGAIFNMQSWSRPGLIFTYDPASDKTTDSGLIPPSKIDTSMLESKEVLVTSYDGTRVPLSIVYRKGLVLDGSHPTFLEGYGAYGVVSESGFWPSSLAWIEKGGVYAVAHVRGGGEYGEDWHRAGMMKTKTNTILDFIACGQYLVDQKYTTPKKLAGNGGSAGGITVGGAMTWAPNLFGVILDQVGMSDTLRAETEPNGPPNVSEFGSTKTLDGFNGLYAMGAYNHVIDGTPYPAVMFFTGANDPRVAPWHMMKMAARVQVASSSGRPVLLRIDYDAGHGIGSNRSQREQELADMWGFALSQMN